MDEGRHAGLVLVVTRDRHERDPARRPEGEILLAATPKYDYLCVQVTDEGDGFVPTPGAMASDENGGYGLFLVERLTRRWGMTRENGRTRVWFEFDYADD